ncbi:Glycosyltransferase involved in cell wall bisynthesis [Micromonospora pattaloongensis]|uniref:Glycosyltransferase involved in cell wall bisynthesis n=1 Tax=Micromonospora pattaloongensis TaxID=405436 RepID=A0A1H3SLB7_9ACTN|nr:glycosyltransferase [Micromonospora pattaloongensis]SDZ37899.1 Glycosyltransferase involved in cell wall bisynthesis [Micromonospora pattaloongensis]
MNVPDVTVVTAVYNTMPYLTACLTSLVEQSIGRGRMEIIAVDDGSTDGSGGELDRLARLYPDTIRVIHQANSGGPAAPSNRALDVATGRYVFFIGSDDYLGPEALERLVEAADRYDSDVVLGRMVGVNSRNIHQAVFTGNEPQIGLFDSALPWSLSNTKLFRRELIEKYGLRYPEDMPMGSDQPFTLEACFRARRISVLSDYDYYFAVRRLNARNITYFSRHLERLECAEKLIEFVAGLIEPGERRDAVLVRHFSWEVARLLENDFLRLDRAAQERVTAGVRRLTREYLSDALRDRLPAELRVRLGAARYGGVDDLLAVLRQDAEGDVPPAVAEGERWFAGYPGFRDPRLGAPDDWFDITDGVADWFARLDTVSVAWDHRRGDRGIVVTARSPRTDLAERVTGTVELWAGSARATNLDTVPDATGTTVRVRFALRDLLADVRPGGEFKIVRTELAAFGQVGSAPLRGPRRATVQRTLCRQGSGLYVVTTTTSHKGQLVIAVAPVTPRRVLARLRRRLPLGGS